MSETKLNLEEASKTIADIIKRRSCPAMEVSQEEVKAELRKKGITTSPNTAGPIIRSAIDDAVLAETLDTEHILPALKAAFQRDRRRIVENAVADLRQKSNKDAQEHEKTLENLAQAISEKNELKIQLSESQARELSLEKELATTNGKISMYESDLKSVRIQYENASKDLTIAQEQIRSTRIELEAAQDEKRNTTVKWEEQEKRLRELEGELFKAQSALKLAEEQAKFRQEEITELKATNASLRDQQRELSDHQQTILEELRQATAGQADAAARLDERNRLGGSGKPERRPSRESSRSPKSKEKKESAAPAEAKTGT